MQFPRVVLSAPFIIIAVVFAASHPITSHMGMEVSSSSSYVHTYLSPFRRRVVSSPQSDFDFIRDKIVPQKGFLST